MNDPAIKAAKRACQGTGLKPRLPSESQVAAAREALKPIRELHHRNEFDHCEQACIDMHGNTQPWPCDTAKLAYPESEL